MKSVVRLAVLHDPMLLLSALGILVGRPPATISARAAQIFAAERSVEAVESLGDKSDVGLGAVVFLAVFAAGLYFAQQ